MTRHANLKTVSTLTALALTAWVAMLVTSAWARGPVYQINDRNSSSVSVLTAESDVVAPLAALTSGKRWFTKGHGREIHGRGLHDQWAQRLFSR